MTLDDCTRLYLHASAVAHLGYSPRGVFCDVMPQLGEDWYGTGSQDEYDKAARMPLCRRCQNIWEAAHSG
jgi:hypothetical protein